jgi:hypothetical protein
MNNRITYTVTKVDAVKELEYSRIPASQSVAQTKPQTGTGTTKTGSTQQTTTTTPKQTTTPVQTQPPAQTQPQQVTQTQTQQPAQSQSSKGSVVQTDGAYIVQIASGGVLDLKQPGFAKVTTQLGLEVKSKLVDGKYKYFVGFFSTITEAKDIADKLKQIGFKDAWARSKY